MPIRSKLPDVGVTIFAVNSRRARELGALNLGQGFPDYDIDPRITELVTEAMRAGHNQYAPYDGVVELREQIAKKVARSYGVNVDPLTEVTVTLGATEGLYDAVQAIIGPGDEAIVFDPCYDTYDPAVRLAGGSCVHVPRLPPDFGYDWERIRAAVTPRTRLIIFNTPNNPSCTVAGANDLEQLAAITRGREIYVLSDEVYEHMVYDGQRHHSLLTHAELRTHGFAVFSFGKTLHSTGLRLGYCIAPPELTSELRKVHQFNTFSLATAPQHALARYLAEKEGTWGEVADFFQRKRDRLRAALVGTPFKLPPAQGTFFQLVDFSSVAPPGDLAFADRLLNEALLCTIPLSPFYREPPPLSVVRLCIAKRDATLDDAAARLRAFKP
jgi:methionine aminotransferase